MNQNFLNDAFKSNGGFCCCRLDAKNPSKIYDARRVPLIFTTAIIYQTCRCYLQVFLDCGIKTYKKIKQHRCNWKKISLFTMRGAGTGLTSHKCITLEKSIKEKV